MPRRRMALILAGALALALSLFIAAGRLSPKPEAQAAERSDGISLVGFSMAEARNPWTTELVDHMSQMAKMYDMELIYHDLEAKTSEAQLEDALKLLDSGIDFLVLLPRVTDIIPQIIEAADAKGIHVVLICNDQSFRNQASAFICIDYELEGRLCARVLAEKYGESACNIVEVLGPEDSAIAAQREAGFRDELENFPQLHIVETVRGNFDRVSAENEITDLIGRMPRGTFQAVFACSDEDGLGALNALKLAGYQPGQEVSIVSINGIQDALKALIAGEYTATIESGKNLGEQTIIIVDRLRSHYLKSRYWVVPYHIYDAQSDAWTLNAALYW